MRLVDDAHEPVTLAASAVMPAPKTSRAWRVEDRPFIIRGE
jgi:hypothetical protein